MTDRTMPAYWTAAAYTYYMFTLRTGSRKTGISTIANVEKREAARALRRRQIPRRNDGASRDFCNFFFWGRCVNIMFAEPMGIWS